jgi:adenylate kinase
MQVVLQEAHESYRPDIIRTMQSDTVEQMDANVAAVVAYLRGR